MPLKFTAMVRSHWSSGRSHVFPSGASIAALFSTMSNLPCPSTANLTNTAVLRFAHVHLRANPFLPCFTRVLEGVGGLLQVADHDPGACSGEHQRDSPADSLCHAGIDGDLILQGDSVRYPKAFPVYWPAFIRHRHYPPAIAFFPHLGFGTMAGRGPGA